MTTGTLTVENIRTFQRRGDEVICYCGRAANYKGRYIPESPLANRHRITEGSGRAEAIALFRKDLWQAIKSRDEREPKYRVLRQLAIDYLMGKRVVLLCWCKPLDCHVDVVARAIRWESEILIDEGLKAIAGEGGEFIDLPPSAIAFITSPPPPIPATPPSNTTTYPVRGKKGKTSRPLPVIPGLEHFAGL
jgi:hypothetical protein